MLNGRERPRLRRGAIVIPTFRRPAGLAKTLEHIARLTTTAALTVIVADNDVEKLAGVAVVRRLEQAGYRFPLRWITVAETGVARVRNDLIVEALADPGVAFVACIDDDEWPDPHWLEALLAMQHETGADAVGGTVEPVFSTRPPTWVDRVEIYRQEAPEGRVEMLWGTSNVLLTRAMLEGLGPPFFDLGFGRSGGEDTEFFHRAGARGFAFAWASAATVFETVPPSRVTLSWMLRRSFRIGSTNALIQLDWRYARLGRTRILVKAAGRLLVAAAQALPALLARSRDRRREGLVRLLYLSARSSGEVAALTGFRDRVYR